MLILIIGLFALAALLGVYLLMFVLQGKNTPKAIVFIHGPLAVTALILLIAYGILFSSYLLISAVVFIMAALGGLALIFRDLTGKSVPKWLALTHGITAITAFILLIAFLYFI